MFVEREGEDARKRLHRMEQEGKAMEALVKAKDAETVIPEIEKFAHRQMYNRTRGIPLDYAQIMAYRAERPELFIHLPSDDECRKALGLPEPVTLRNGETVEGEMTVGISEGAQSRTLKLKK